MAALALTGTAAPIRKPSGFEKPVRSAEANARYPANTLVFFACQSGRRTLDSSATAPGNPFATAFISMIAEPAIDLEQFAAGLFTRTRSESHGFQLVDSPPVIAPAQLKLSSAATDMNKIAMVLVVSAYNGGTRLPSLPGARFDAERVAGALQKAGYETSIVVDMGKAEIETQLDGFAERAGSADVALIYTTGHGLEVGGESYVLMRDFDLADGPEGLNHRALSVSTIAAATRAKTANLVFSAACRDNPMEW